MTSGSYTDSWPVRVFTIVAWTNAPRLAALAMVQPDCAGVIPFGPVSWYGVAIPCADSGFAGTMMLQLVLAAAVVAGAVPVPLGHGAADAVVVGVAEPEAAVVGAAEPEAAVVGAVEPEAAAV